MPYCEGTFRFLKEIVSQRRATELLFEMFDSEYPSAVLESSKKQVLPEVEGP